MAQPSAAPDAIQMATAIIGALLPTLLAQQPQPQAQPGPQPAVPPGQPAIHLPPAMTPVAAQPAGPAPVDVGDVLTRVLSGDPGSVTNRPSSDQIAAARVALDGRTKALLAAGLTLNDVA